MENDRPFKGKEAVIYCRSALHGNDGTIQSWAQSDKIRHWASKQGVTIAGEFYEISDTTEYPRKILKMAIDQTRKSRASFLICYNQSRLTQDQTELELMKKHLGKKQIYCLEGGYL